MVNKFRPPKAVSNSVKRGMVLQKQFNREDLPEQNINKNDSFFDENGLSLETIYQMQSFFAKNEKRNKPKQRYLDGGPTSGTIAWLLWGGNCGRTWADSVIKRAHLPLEEIVRVHNRENPHAAQKTSIANLKQVVKRGSNELHDTVMDRLNAYLRLLRKGNPGNPNYVHDNDLLPPSHKLSTKNNVLGVVNVSKVDEELGVVFGYAIVCKQRGEEYYDIQGDHIPEESMLKAAFDFMSGNRVAKDMHEGKQTGQVLFGMPITQEIAESLRIDVNQTGLIVGMKPSSNELLEKYKTGEYTGFSIGGRRIMDTEVDTEADYEVDTNAD